MLAAEGGRMNHVQPESESWCGRNKCGGVSLLWQTWDRLQLSKDPP